MAIRFTTPFPRFFTDNDVLLSGGFLYFYVDDGGTTPKATYSDNELTVANTNPVKLSDSGVVPDIFLDGAYRVVLTTKDGVQVGVAKNYNSGSGGYVAWGNWDPEIDYESGPNVIVTGSNGFYYKSIQTPNLGNDPISSPAYWERVPMLGDTAPFLGGPLDTNSHQVQWSKGADVVSALELPILDDGNYFDVTGSNPITSIATTGRVGTVIKLHFDAVLFLTHNATDLVLPTGASIVTAAGDEAEFVEYASGDFRCTDYSRADGKPISLPAYTYISGGTASSIASIDFTNIGDTYDEYEIRLLNIIPATDGVDLILRTSSDNGVSFDSGASDYEYGYIYLVTGTPTGVSSGTGQSIWLADNVGSDTNEYGVCGTVTIYQPSESFYTRIGFNGNYADASSNHSPIIANGIREENAAVDAVQILFTGGNIESGKLALYGVKRS